MSRLKVAVVGTGHLGRIHAKLAATIDEIELVAIADPNVASLPPVDGIESVRRVKSHDEILDDIDAAIVAAPTFLHAEIATDLLSAGKHVFVEKPLTLCPAEASRLTRYARQQNRVLQVGHVERFNPAWQAACDEIGPAKYIEAVRASSFPGRCLDAGVVMDLMIHDLDLVLSVARGPVVRVEASGMAVVTDHEDLVEARITFGCGLVASLKASRISPVPARDMQLYGEKGFARIDFGKPEVIVTRPHQSILDRSFQLDQLDSIGAFREELFTKWLAMDAPELQSTNAILEEQREFHRAITEGIAPRVDGEAGAKAVEVAAEILAAVERRAWDGAPSRPQRIGLHAMPARPATSDATRRAA